MCLILLFLVGETGADQSMENQSVFRIIYSATPNIVNDEEHHSSAQYSTKHQICLALFVYC